ncbi:uncharacterized protein THITE_2118361 [Thermothielavioides terrestris NRRL 8126]|uniref:Uncharacterized protein n=1 Tax=Thermothielavioides terrestris (strain ATCC 38088 / NRRL 8126) TaxID=578455 RepID=G2R9R3_THETT|nr:uncharacterized protein THITE_2118361 [Thermothielavioides terrestris NRRL 8126]AEO68751.1 hypothetical protein THITE_2118361 [Thermothielavioides terrestris NRRL 8126]
MAAASQTPRAVQHDSRGVAAGRRHIRHTVTRGFAWRMPPWAEGFHFIVGTA